MKFLIPPSGKAHELIGTQQASFAEACRFSTLVQPVEVPEGTLLYGTLTGELLLLETGEGDPKDPGTLSEDIRKTLIEKWFLVPESFDETKAVDELREVMRLTLPPEKEKTQFTVFTTMDCNARCSYCYELGRRKYPMTLEIAKRAAAHIIEVSHGKPVRISWFGGEPLTNIPVIETILGALKDAGVSYRSRITTNGLLLTPELAAHAVKDWHLDLVQITLDGTEERYNRVKNYRNATGSPFRTVLDNIDGLLRAGAHVHIRINFEAEMLSDFEALMELLAERFGGREGFTVGTAPVLRTDRNGKQILWTEEEIEARMTLIRKMDALGLTATAEKLKPVFRLNRCMGDSDQAEVILPDGHLGKCEHFSETELTGSLFSPERDRALIRAWKETYPAFPECRTCPLYPGCVNLKKCEWISNGCLSSAKEAGIHELKRQIGAAYGRILTEIAPE